MLGLGTRATFISRESKFELGYHIDKYVYDHPDGSVTSVEKQTPMRRKRKK